LWCLSRRRPTCARERETDANPSPLSSSILTAPSARSTRLRQAPAALVIREARRGERPYRAHRARARVSQHSRRMQRETACFTSFPVGRRHPPDSPAVHLRRIGKHHVASNLVVLNGLMIRLSYHPWSMPLAINHAHGKLPTVEVSPGVAASRDMWMGGEVRV